MADMNDLYFFGDDFDAVLDLLEDEEELNEQFREAAVEVSAWIIYSNLKYSEKLRENVTLESWLFGACAVLL